MTVISQTEADARHIKRSDYPFCAVACIDCKKPGSHLKQNYASIGPVVTSSNVQAVNLPEAHGSYIGAAAIPPGITNNRHIHFTAENCITPMATDEIAALRSYSPEEMRQRVVSPTDRDFRPGFIDLELPECGAEIAPVLGNGISRNRDHAAKIANPHGLSMEWLRIPPGQRVSPFTLHDKRIVIPLESGVRAVLNADVVVDLGAWEAISIPEGVVRGFENTGEEAIEMLVIVAGDHQKRPECQPDVFETAFATGHALDAQGYVASAFTYDLTRVLQQTKPES